MIIARAPLRVSFAGGGTDIPQFFSNHGFGATVSTSINRYVYVTLNEKFDGRVSLRYKSHEEWDTTKQIYHHLVRECLLYFGIERGVEIVIISDVPARGSGLGASSALAVALVASILAWQGKEESKESIAKIAANIEISKTGSPIGYQDHCASSFGGFNLIRYQILRDRTVQITRELQSFSNEFRDEIEAGSLLFYLNSEHKYRENHFVPKILHEQIQEIGEKSITYKLQRDNAIAMWENMSLENFERFGDHVSENWRIKRKIHNEISNPEIDRVIEIAMSKGAHAAKVCGAGGGGFVYFLANPSYHQEIRNALSGFPELNCKFEERGVEVIFNDRTEIGIAAS